MVAIAKPVNGSLARREKALEYRQKYNWSVIPINPESKKPLIRWKNGPENYQDTVASAETITGWFSQWPSANVGIVTGAVSGLFVLDCDSEESYQAAQECGLPKTPIAKTGKGYHIYFKHPGPDHRIKGCVRPEGDSSEKAAFDFRCDGNYVVAAPSIHPTRKTPYTWIIPPESAPLADIPAWVWSTINSLVSSRKYSTGARNAYQGADSPYAAAVLKNEVEKLRNTGEGKRNVQLNKSAFLVAQFVGGGELEQENAYSALYDAASETGLEPGDIEDTLDSAFAAGVNQPRNSPNQATQGAVAAAPIKLLSYEDLCKLPPIKWLIKDLVPEESLIELYGPYGCGKSFLALSWALEVAQQGYRVVYVASEGHRAYNKRIDAWKLENGVRDLKTGNFRVIGEAVPMQDPQKVAPLIAALAPFNPQVIIVDTMARAIVGGSDSDDKAVGLFVAACDKIRKQFGCSVIVIHHSGKNLEAGSKGSVALPGAADIVLELTETNKDKGLLRLKCIKTKDNEAFKPKAIERKTIKLPNGETSCAVVPGDSDDNPALLLTGNERLILEYLVDSGTPVGKTDIVNGANIPGSSFWKAIKALQNKEYVVASGTDSRKHYAATALGIIAIRNPKSITPILI